MSDRRPEPTQLIVEYQEQTCTCSEPDWCNRNGVRYRTAQRVADPADILAAVRRGVESGTIEGEVVRSGFNIVGSRWQLSVDVPTKGDYIVIGPVSDGGSET